MPVSGIGVGVETASYRPTGALLQQRAAAGRPLHLAEVR